VTVTFGAKSAPGVYLGVRDERDYPAVVRLSSGATVRVWRSGEWTRVEGGGA
jgi:hypothetical protein